MRSNHAVRQPNYNSHLQVVYGGQWGSEGKGQIAAYLARRTYRMEPNREFIAVRVGGPNAGHTITDIAGIERKLQQIPCAVFVHPKARGLVGPAGLILPEVFFRELNWLGETLGGPRGKEAKITFDPSVCVITEENMAQEAELKKSIASTGEGVGAATAAKAMRTATTVADWLDTLDDEQQVLFHKWCDIQPTTPILNGPTEERRTVQVEGTQGYWLSLNASGYYPFVTSRDCGPDAILSQVNTSPRAFGRFEAWCVIRTHPIRVGGNSGDLPNEMTWDEIYEQTEGHVKAPEVTTVTLKARRIAKFDPAMNRDMLDATRPTHIALTFADYHIPDAARAVEEGMKPNDVLASSRKLIDVLGHYQKLIDQQIDLLSFGPGYIADTHSLEVTG